MSKIKKISGLAFASMFLMFSTASQAITLPFFVFENDPGGFSGTLEVVLNGNSLETTFSNTSTPTTAKGPIMAQVYFETGAADWISNPTPTDTVDVDFNLGANPPNPPGGNNIGWQGTAFAFGAANPAPDNGINPGESLLITWDWLGGDFDAFVQDILNGNSRVASHVLDCTDNGNSCSAYVVPIPAAVWLFGTGLVGLIGFSRRKSASACPS